MQNRRLLKISAVLALAAVLLTGCGIIKEETNETDILMGTVFSVKYTTEGAGKGQKLWNELEQTGTNLDDKILSWRSEEAEIAKINASAGSEEGYPVSEELEKYLAECIEVSERTGGAFDITLGSLTQLWNIDEKALVGEGNIPSDEEIAKALDCSGYKKIRLEDHRIYLPEGLGLDMGAVGKGIYLQKAKDILEDKALQATVSAGGSILLCREDGVFWRVGIVDPFNPSQVYGTIKGRGNAYISTSGDYERFFFADGEKYHHILDSKTGFPADSGIKSVTIVMNTDYEMNGLISDALSTAVFVLGEELGVLHAKRYGAEVLIIRNDGSYYATDKMQSMLEID